MKTKKHSKKNRKATPYTPGYNVFGDKAKTQLIVLERETAFEQMMDAICQLNGEMEFTFDSSCFIGHEEEMEEVMAKVSFFLSMMAKSKGMPLYEISDSINKCR